MSASAPTLQRALRLARTTMIYGGFALIVLFGLRFSQLSSLTYLDWSPEAFGRFWPNRYLLIIHVITATLALVIAPLQFIAFIRNRWPRVHRAVGWTYIGCALFSAPVAIWLSTYSSCVNCIPPFIIWGSLWFITTSIALLMAVRRRFAVHRDFMIRSYVLMNGFVFVRLDGWFTYPLPVGPGVDREALIIWIAWVVPLLITEMFLSWSPTVQGRGRGRPLAASASG